MMDDDIDLLLMVGAQKILRTFCCNPMVGETLLAQELVQNQPRVGAKHILRERSYIAGRAPPPQRKTLVRMFALRTKRAQSKHHTQLANVNFDENLDVTAEFCVFKLP